MFIIACIVIVAYFTVVGILTIRAENAHNRAIVHAYETLAMVNDTTPGR